MSRKNLAKFILDVFMLLVLLAMYNKKALGVGLHEIIGLGLLAVFIIHILINGKWITAVSARLFRRGLPVKTKVSYLVSCLLLLAFIAVGVSGIFISEILFNLAGSPWWKSIHLFSAACALLLMGLHLGLNKSFISGIVRKILPLPAKLARITGLICTAILLVYGGLALTSTSFSNWLAVPFDSSAQISGGGGNYWGGEAQLSSENSATTDGAVEQSANGGGHGQGRHGASTPLWSSMIDYFSIIFMFSFLAYLLEVINKKLRRPATIRNKTKIFFI